VSVQVAGEERSGRHGPSETRAAVLTVDFIGFWPLHARADHSIGMETFGARFPLRRSSHHSFLQCGFTPVFVLYVVTIGPAPPREGAGAKHRAAQAKFVTFRSRACRKATMRGLYFRIAFGEPL